ncbi:hypothetical protein FNX44_026320 [Streptomyces sp. OF1]|uniref:Uncharacterized protein n=1 Tax=Streptomyces alkaliterrae TaxID=2213162 RepID=A0A5P0YYA4_9ACTN|nr:hypothetical protein [Streptomyces alkaliterrae]
MVGPEGPGRAGRVGAGCERCVELREEERRAEGRGDPSGATDCRVLLRRHAGECRAAGEGAL